MRPFWRPKSRQKEASSAVLVGSHDDKLSRIEPLHIDPDDDQPTREDKDAEKAARRPPPGAIG